jgi:acyl carrier protein
MKNISEEDLLKLIAEALDISAEELSIESSSKNLIQWDSLGQLSILSTLEKNIGGDLAKLSELGAAESVESIMEILDQNGFLA